LRDVGLEVWPGEFVVLLGPSGSLGLSGSSGSGKTTLLDLVGGIEEPTSGRIEAVGLFATVMAATLLSYRTESCHWSLHMRTLTSVYVALAVMAASLLAQAPVLRTLRRIDIDRIVRERRHSGRHSTLGDSLSGPPRPGTERAGCTRG
jgi:energy-coupling factor transporter ATP-binding protein EcfA2